MTSKVSVHCRLCNEALAEDEELEHHLLEQHKPSEVARALASEWENDEYGP